MKNDDMTAGEGVTIPTMTNDLKYFIFNLYTGNIE